MITISTGIDPNTETFTLNVNSWHIDPPFDCGVLAVLQPRPDVPTLAAVAFLPLDDDGDSQANS